MSVVAQLAEQYRQALFSDPDWLHRLFDGDATAHQQVVLMSVVLGVPARRLVIG